MMEHDIEDVESVSGSQSSSSGSYKDEYGELFELDEPMSLSAYMKACYSIDVPQDSEIFCKLQQYQVVQACDGHANLFGVKTNQKRYFAKYASKEQYEAEKRSHEVLDPLNCPSIIKLVDAIPIGAGGIIITPMYDRYSHGTFYYHPKRVMTCLLQALKVCHDNGIAHRDIKPHNIVWYFADRRCRTLDFFLTDFGIACFDFKEYENKTIQNMPGTLRYYSPERLRGEIPPDPRVCDMFAAGVVFLECVMQTSKHAFKNGTLDEIYHVLNNFDEVVGCLLLPHAADLLKKMLEVDYKKRITVTEALEHRFFSEPHCTRIEYSRAHPTRMPDYLIFTPAFLIEHNLK